MIKHAHHPKYKTLVEWLVTARKEQELTVRQLAVLIDEPFQFVSKIETRQRKLNVFEYLQYCRALNLDPSEGLRMMGTAED